MNILSKITKKHLILFIAFIISLISSFFIFRNLKQKQSQSQILSVQDAPSPTPLPSAPEELTQLTFLLLGMGGPGHQGGALTDTIIVANIDFKSQKLTLITIPRDFYITFPDGNSRKLNTAFAKDTSLAKSLISSITNLPINYYIAIDFVGFQRLIGEVLDGIKVNIPNTLDDPWYPIEGEQLNLCGHSPEKIASLTKKYSGFKLQQYFECRYEHLHFDAGPITFEGGDALKYVRSRHTSSDFDRSQRQIAVLKGFKDKLFSLDVFKDAPKWFKKALYTINTDLDQDIIKYITPALANSGEYQIIPVYLNTSNVLGASTSTNIIPKKGLNDFSQIHEFINSTINN